MTSTLDFKATVEDSEIWNLNHYLTPGRELDICPGKTTAYVEYELEPEVRSWGIKGIAVVIRRVKTSIEWEVDGDDLTEEDKEALRKAGGTEMRNGSFSGTVEIDTKYQEWNDWKTESEVEFETDGAMSINAVSIDLKDKSITVS